MSKFFVGQRVRLVYSDNPRLKRFVGKEAILIARCNVFQHCWDVDVEGNRSVLDGVPFSWHEVHMEPILDRPAMSSWDAMRDLGLPVPADLVGEKA